MKKVLLLISFLSLVANPVLSQESQIVAGAGPSTKIVQLFVDGFAKLPACAEYNFSVMPVSIKHKGGILNSDKYLFGRTGRPLNAKEVALGKDEIFLAKVPVTFAKGLAVGVSSLSMKQVEAIFSGKLTNWKELGGDDAPILLVGREQTEALFQTLKADHPFFNDVTFDKTFKKDGQVIKFLTSPQGKHAISFGAKPNFSKHNILTVADFSSGVNLGLVVDKKNSQHPVVLAAKDYAKTEKWHRVVLENDLLIAQ